jgi:nicotinamidase-related amidase
MEPDKTVLVVVDVQNGFVGSRSRHVVPVIVDLVHRWQARGGSTIFSRYLNYPGSPYERLIGWTRMRSAPEADLVTELQPYAAKAVAVVNKTIYSLFNDQGVDIFARGGWTDLLICGIATESCVCKTAVDAFERDLTPWVLVDACASHAGTATHEAGLVVTGRFIGKRQLISTSDLPLWG